MKTNNIKVVISAISILFLICGCRKNDELPNYFGFKIGEQVSLAALNTDESKLEYEEVDYSRELFHLRGSHLYYFRPKSKLQDFDEYQLIVDKDTGKIKGMIASSKREITLTAPLKKHGSEAEEIFRKTVKWLDSQIGNFSRKVGDNSVRYLNNFTLDGEPGMVIVYFSYDMLNLSRTVTLIINDTNIIFD